MKHNNYFKLYSIYTSNIIITSTIEILTLYKMELFVYVIIVSKLISTAFKHKYMIIKIDIIKNSENINNSNNK